jgi:hypothetical protein
MESTVPGDSKSPTAGGLQSGQMTTGWVNLAGMTRLELFSRLEILFLSVFGNKQSPLEASL